MAGIPRKRRLRYVSLVLPHVLQRLPYGPDTVPVEGVNFIQDVDGLDASKYLWGNAAWMLVKSYYRSFCLIRLVCGDPRCGRRRPGIRSPGAYVLHAIRRYQPALPDGNSHYRQA